MDSTHYRSVDNWTWHTANLDGLIGCKLVWHQTRESPILGVGAGARLGGSRQLPRAPQGINLGWSKPHGSVKGNRVDLSAVNRFVVTHDVMHREHEVGRNKISSTAFVSTTAGNMNLFTHLRATFNENIACYDDSIDGGKVNPLSETTSVSFQPGVAERQNTPRAIEWIKALDLGLAGLPRQCPSYSPRIYQAGLHSSPGIVRHLRSEHLCNLPAASTTTNMMKKNDHCCQKVTGEGC